MKHKFNCPICSRKNHFVFSQEKFKNKSKVIGIIGLKYLKANCICGAEIHFTKHYSKPFCKKETISYSVHIKFHISKYEIFILFSNNNNNYNISYLRITSLVELENGMTYRRAHFSTNDWENLWPIDLNKINALFLFA